MDIHIMMGLPGSGKTFYARNNFSTMDFSFLYLDNLDKNEVSGILKSKIKRNNDLVIDGLIGTDQFIYDYIIPNLCGYSYNIILHFWEEDREACIHNDQFRRDKSSLITIKRMRLVEPSIYTLNNLFDNVNFSIEYHEVFKIPDWAVFANKYNLYIMSDSYNSYGYLKSDGWVTGGQVASCSTELEDLDVEEPIDTFDQLYNLLEKLHFTTEDNYFDLMELATIDTEIYTGYYGSWEEISYYTISVELLYNYLLNISGLETLI